MMPLFPPPLVKFGACMKQSASVNFAFSCDHAIPGAALHPAGFVVGSSVRAVALGHLGFHFVRA